MASATLPPSKREALDALSRKDLAALGEALGLEAADRRSRAGLLDALCKPDAPDLGVILELLSREALKEVCRHLGVDDRGREKAVLSGRILGTEAVQHGLVFDRKQPKPGRTMTDADVAPDDLEPPSPDKLTAGCRRPTRGSAREPRRSIDSSDYKSYIFGLLFPKRLSDVFEEEAEALVADGEPERIAWEDPDEHQFFVPPSARWSKLQKTATNIGEAIDKACIAVEDANSILDGVLARISFNDELESSDKGRTVPYSQALRCGIFRMCRGR